MPALADPDSTRYGLAHQLNSQSTCLLVVEEHEDTWGLFQFALTKHFPDVDIQRTGSHQQAIAFLNDRLQGKLPSQKLILQSGNCPWLMHCSYGLDGPGVRTG